MPYNETAHSYRSVFFPGAEPAEPEFEEVKLPAPEFVAIMSELGRLRLCLAAREIETAH